MRISISHETVRKGLIVKKTYYEVHLMVAFTHEEKQIIRQRAYSGMIRQSIPIASGTPFQFYPACDSGVSGTL